MRGYLSLELNMKELYMRNIFDAYWKNNLDLSDKKVLLNVLKSSNINPNMFFEKIKNLEIKEKLKNLTKQAHDQEIFGAPTFLVNGKIFWGQDRLDFALDEYNK
jgi:2-hydroxychromene-2-carboxylate isomerase